MNRQSPPKSEDASSCKTTIFLRCTILFLFSILYFRDHYTHVHTRKHKCVLSVGCVCTWLCFFDTKKKLFNFEEKFSSFFFGKFAFFLLYKIEENWMTNFLNCRWIIFEVSFYVQSFSFTNRNISESLHACRHLYRHSDSRMLRLIYYYVECRVFNIMKFVRLFKWTFLTLRKKNKKTLKNNKIKERKKIINLWLGWSFSITMAFII